MATKRIRRANILYNNPYQDLEQLGFGSWLDSQKEGLPNLLTLQRKLVIPQEYLDQKRK